MAEFQFDQVSVLFVDPDGGSRDSIRSILQNNGFRSIRSGGSFIDLIKGAEPPGPDLLICETDVEGGDVCQWIRNMRHQQAGCDPFLPVIATTWTPTPDLVRRVIDAGADDLLTKPLSSELLLNRIRTLSLNRKPFVVTSDYIGPDRHRRSERPNTAKLVEVPNRLKASSLGQAGSGNSEEMYSAIESALSAINEQKIDHHVERIGQMVRRLSPALEAGTDNDVVNRDLRALYEVVDDIRQRMEGTAYEQISELCDTMLSVVESIRGAPGNASSRDQRLLGPLSQAIEASFVGAGGASARQVLSSVEGANVFLDAETTRALEEADNAQPSTSERRTKFVLRLVAGKISHLLSNHTGRRQVIPRTFLRGFDEYLVMLLGETLYDELNPKARAVLEEIGSDDDTVIWRTIQENEEYLAFSYSVLVHILLKFSNFHRGKRNFMGIVNTVIAETLRENRTYDGRDVFTEGHFNLIFTTLFADVFNTLTAEGGAEQIDEMVGEGTAVQLDEIYKEYKLHTQRGTDEAKQ